MAIPSAPAIPEDLIGITDLPAGVIVGYDTKSLTLAQDKKFLGLKEIPEGVHFVWAGSRDNSSRSGFWIITPYVGTVKNGKVVVKGWDVSLEGLISEPMMDNAGRLGIAINKYKDQLIPYHAPTPGTVDSDISARLPTIWQDLTSCIKESTLSHITQTTTWNNWHVSTTDENIEDDSPDSTVRIINEETLNFFFPHNKQTFSSEALGRERTNQAMDTTTHVTSVINNQCYGNSNEIIGELQFCYLTGMVMGNISCLTHWQHIVKIVFGAPQLTLDNPSFFTKFVDAIHAQFRYDNVGIEGSIFDHDNELHSTLRTIIARFKARFEEIYVALELTDDQKEFQMAFEKFESFLGSFEGGWDLSLNYLRVGRLQMEDGEFVDAELTEFQDEDERGEYAPAIVNLDEDGRESGLIRF